MREDDGLLQPGAPLVTYLPYGRHTQGHGNYRRFVIAKPFASTLQGSGGVRPASIWFPESDLASSEPAPHSCSSVVPTVSPRYKLTFAGSNQQTASTWSSDATKQGRKREKRQSKRAGERAWLLSRPLMLSHRKSHRRDRFRRNDLPRSGSRIGPPSSGPAPHSCSSVFICGSHSFAPI